MKKLFKAAFLFASLATLPAQAREISVCQPYFAANKNPPCPQGWVWHYEPLPSGGNAAYKACVAHMPWASRHDDYQITIMYLQHTCRKVNEMEYYQANGMLGDQQ